MLKSQELHSLRQLSEMITLLLLSLSLLSFPLPSRPASSSPLGFLRDNVIGRDLSRKTKANRYAEKTSPQRRTHQNTQCHRFLLTLAFPLQSPPNSVFVYGHTATGKTEVVKGLLQGQQRVAWINCIDALSTRTVFESILNQLNGHISSPVPAPSALHPPTHPMFFLTPRLASLGQ